MAIAKTREMSEFSFKLAPLFDHFCGQRGFDLGLQLK